MKAALSFLASALVISGLAIVILFSQAYAGSGHHECHHHHDCDEPGPEPMPNPGPVVVNKKKVVVSAPALLLGVAGGVCIYKRFWTDDPCIGAPAPRKTSDADDQVVPVIPTGRLYQ